MGGEKGRSGGRVNRPWRGHGGGKNEGKRWEGRGPKSHSKNSDFGTLLISESGLPTFIHPPPLRGSFQGWGGGGV